MSQLFVRTVCDMVIVAVTVIGQESEYFVTDVMSRGYTSKIASGVKQKTLNRQKTRVSD